MVSVTARQGGKIRLAVHGQPSTALYLIVAAQEASGTCRAAGQLCRGFTIGPIFLGLSFVHCQLESLRKETCTSMLSGDRA